MKLTTAFLATTDGALVEKIFGEPGRERIARLSHLLPEALTPENLEKFRKEAAEVNVLFTCWGFPHDLLTPENFPALKLVLYSGGSVKNFARPLMERGVWVVSARDANAIPVAYFCLGQIILSCKGFFRNTRECREPERMRLGNCYGGPGLYGEKIALLGMGAVARELVSLLRQCDLNVLAMDPYLEPDEAATLNVEPVSMEEAFANAFVVSNHLPNLPELQGVIDRKLLASMRPHATFINTGRGAQVNEADLTGVARERPDLVFLLDVTEPEPPAPDSPLYELPNVQLSTHIAGAMNDEVRRLGDLVIEEFVRYQAGQPLLYAHTLEMLDRLA